MISPQIDKCIDFNGHAQPATNIRYIDGDVTTCNVQSAQLAMMCRVTEELQHENGTKWKD